ncbi:MAG: gfo/Idh/MocA family oxidoreductase [Planctomycetota bacterium]|nr:MAG: gfo/Idh/MocA family oxidoreductase [Planctomycetota bacterium]
MLLPELAKLSDVRFRGIVTGSGVTAATVGRKYGFDWCASSIDELLNDDETDVVFIVTRHSQHADMITRALAAGKAVFCEKPLAVDWEQLRSVVEALQTHGGPLSIGYNRRFSAFAHRMKTHFDGCGALRAIYRVNAGTIPHDHWLSDPAEGGRIIGEACHFVDFFNALTGSLPVSVSVDMPADADIRNETQAVVRYEDSSVLQLTYAVNGPAGWSKERIEVFGGGKGAVIEDFRVLELIDDDGRRTKTKLRKMDKGHGTMLAAWMEAVRRGEFLISIDDLVATTRTTFAMAGMSDRPSPDAQ